MKSININEICILECVCALTQWWTMFLLFPLVALSVAEMKSLTVNGCVGNNVTFKCSNWNVWIDVKNNEKYFCNSPCSEEEHIIRAAFQKTGRKNRIEITNSADGLFVTFTNLQKSDSKKYYCGVHRLNTDPLIEVNLEVTDGKFMLKKYHSYKW